MRKQITLSDYDLKEWRERALWPRHTRSKAEKHYDYLVGSKYAYKISRKDHEIVMKLYATYWELQALIMDEENTDSSMQRSYIEQQNDIMDECERVYNKYINV